MDTTKTSATYHHHAVATAALLIIQKTLEKLVQHGVITSDQLTDIYESIRQEHEKMKTSIPRSSPTRTGGGSYSARG